MALVPATRSHHPTLYIQTMSVDKKAAKVSPTLLIRLKFAHAMILECLGPRFTPPQEDHRPRHEPAKCLLLALIFMDFWERFFSATSLIGRTISCYFQDGEKISDESRSEPINTPFSLSTSEATNENLRGFIRNKTQLSSPRPSRHPHLTLHPPLPPYPHTPNAEDRQEGEKGREDARC